MDTVTQTASRDAAVCAICLDAILARRMWQYPGIINDTLILVVRRNDRIKHVTSSEMIEALRAAVIAKGKDVLGLKAENLNPPSFRPGAAIAMYLGLI